ncbi:MAG: DHH family phosphoesterase [Patescibacteria group bacterium]
MNFTTDKIFERLNAAQRILIVCHVNPDADTLGSAAAFFNYLTDQNKNVICFCQNEIPQYLSEFKNHLRIIHELDSQRFDWYDTIVTLDCGEAKQTGINDFIAQRSKNCFVINIDHHHTNDIFGDLNLVMPDASSTSEIIYELFRAQRVKLNRKILNLLLTGIMADTTFFSNGATKAASLSIASELLSGGADLKVVMASLWKNKNIDTLKFWGQILSRLEYSSENEIAYTVITRRDLAEKNLSEEVIGGLSNFLTNLYQPKFVLVLRETDNGQIKGSLRTTRNDVDVSKLAQRLGGGGHKKAAGFTIDGKLEKVGGRWMIK